MNVSIKENACIGTSACDMFVTWLCSIEILLTRPASTTTGA
jgi:hypothetical protein